MHLDDIDKLMLFSRVKTRSLQSISVTYIKRCIMHTYDTILMTILTKLTYNELRILSHRSRGESIRNGRITRFPETI